MSRRHPLSRLALLAALLPLAARSEDLPEVLARMDRAAHEFKAMSARMKQVEFTAVLNETSETEGVIRLRRTHGGTVGLVEFQRPEPRMVYINGHTVQVYYPKANTVQIYNAQKYKGKMDEVLLVGFGTSGAELKNAYDIKVGGTEMLGSTRTTRLELTPKSDELKNILTKIELWIPEGQSNPVQEKATEPSRNYELFTYSDLKVNPEPPLPDSAFELKLPPGVKKLTP